ncbi:unnamed protein product [Didymodactylos carnosus]|uniref:non-specific serine/threonine protein kinase n=1 Tax=Didymodactylos carnosus TaxID=1234261 RepID=A0A814K7Z0_9BILA|nr:unnamed protein product [Didymodactylos carnosus]CAF1047369.1 unnamed protein product [Didymodactylos carnosus]CAF3729054.1 unnamed protein product [Didymodactylos carnosus]CAF3817113.1 unnamed protein product [Didymodactylos carnosus]
MASNIVSKPDKLPPFLFQTKRNAITDDYEVRTTIVGKGFNGPVYTCFDRQTGQKCALKIIKDSAKARREVNLHKKASECPYIVHVIEIYENKHSNQRCLLIVMEYMAGGELFDRIKRIGDEGSFTERQAASIVHSIGKAVQYLHSQNIAHRDLKPENLLFTSNDEDAVLKLTDFGFAKECSNLVKTLHTPCYTPYYVAPEVLSKQSYDKSCDIWGLGVITYIVLCGYPPFYSKHNASMSPEMKRKIRAGEYRFPDSDWNTVSHEAKDLIRAMLTVEPESRPTIEEVLQSPWLSKFAENVPNTSLNTPAVLVEQSEQWPDVGAAIRETNAYNRMLSVENEVQEISLDNNLLFRRRQRRQNTAV